MMIDRLLYPITSLGPGNRFGIWTRGCSKHCLNCASQELWSADSESDLPVPALVSAIQEALGGVLPDGFTITGGDPLEQPEDLLELVKALSSISEDILVYTGFTYEELQKNLPEAYLAELKRRVAVLIDGRYVDALNDNESPLRGSVNQNVIFFKEQFREPYRRYCEQGRTLQNVYYRDTLMSVGIHNKDQEDNNG